MLGDLRDRLDAIHAFPNQYLYGPTDADLAAMLRFEEFCAGFDEEAVAAEYREAIYAIVEKGDYSREEFASREKRYKDDLQTAREAFCGTLSMSEFRHLSDFLESVSASGSVVEVLEAYVGADRRFSAYELALTSAARRIESAAQFQIDLDRGK